MPPVDFRVYLVTDRQQTAGRPLVPLLQEALSAGVRAVQVREKDLDTRPLLELGREVLALARPYGARVLINDRVDLALALGADGVHLRADSMPVRAARRLLRPDQLLGVSTHAPDEVVAAETEGADFVVLGPIYDTPSKRAYGAPIGLAALAEAARRCRIPIFAIGGIGPKQVREVREAGAFGVAVISAIMSAGDVASSTRELLTLVHSM
ncbi:thiamine phosphate synthase [Candidatus Nitrospira bockiana]